MCVALSQIDFYASLQKLNADLQNDDMEKFREGLAERLGQERVDVAR